VVPHRIEIVCFTMEQDEQKVYMVTELCEGGDLEQYLKVRMLLGWNPPALDVCARWALGDVVPSIMVVFGLMRSLAPPTLPSFRLR